jgi:CHAT domain-containing protein/tetratricopeptide (TPR) repeat protein
MRTRALIGVFVFLTSSALVTPLIGHEAQQEASVAVVVLLERARKATIALSFQEAERLTDEALALAEKTGDRVGQAMSFRQKGFVLLESGRSRDAIGWYERSVATFEALDDKRGIAEALTGLCGVYNSLGDRPKVKEYGTRALALLPDTGTDTARARLLLILSSAGVFSREEAGQALKSVLETGRRLSDHYLVGYVFKATASDQFNEGDYSASQKNYEQAIAEFEAGGELEEVAASYLSLGRVYRVHGDFEGAIRHYQKAIDILGPTSERYTIVEATNAKAIALGYLNRSQESLATYERGLALARESGNPRLIDFMEGNLAGGLIAAGEYARAIPLLEQAIAKNPERSLLGYRLHALGNALSLIGRPADAVEPMMRSIAIAREFKQNDPLVLRLGDCGDILSTLDRFEDALSCSKEAISIMESARQRLVPSDFLKRGYADRMQASYRRLVYLLGELNRSTEAIEVAEQGRSRAFLDLMAAASTSTAFGTRGTETTPAAVSDRPDLHSGTLGQPLDAKGIRETAKRLNTTVVSYWVNDEIAFIWIIGSDRDPLLTKVPIKKERLASLVSATTSLLRDTSKTTATRGAETAVESASRSDEQDPTALPLRGLGVMSLAKDDKSAWRELYKTLIEPVRAQLPARGSRITIVPHGPLLQLSFAALQNGAGRYLVEDYEINYAPSISALDFTGRRQQQIAGNSAGPWAVVGNPATLPLVNDRQLQPLPGAAREVAAVSAFAPKGRLVRIEGVAADEASVARALETSHPSVLHFATHGFVFSDPKQPPFLALNRKGKTDADDGRLTLDEVYGLRLTTDLVVLSACRSGAGQVSSDGIIGLTRGFFYAGSPSVLATFWDVVDEATANLMTGFYRSYAKSHAKGASLRTAQLALLRDLRAGKIIVTAGGRQITLPEHPLLWAAFFLSGEP